MTTAILQAGGKSERMRRTFGPTHKALLPVLGVCLLERNLCQLLAGGFRQIVVVTARDERAIAQYVETRGSELAQACQASVRCVVEPESLGTIGAAAIAGDREGPVLVLYADNLTTLNMKALVAHHTQSQAAMTLATHQEPFRIPFGEVVSQHGHVVDYREKSVHPIQISSGVYVLGSQALGALRPGERIDSPQLVLRLLAQGRAVADYAHQELWMDVNDSAALAKVECLIAEHPQRLEFLRPVPDRHAQLVLDAGRKSLYRVTEQAAMKENAGVGSLASLTFDEIDTADGAILRWNVELIGNTSLPDTFAWLNSVYEAPPALARDRRAVARTRFHLASLPREPQV